MKNWILRHCDLDLEPKVINFNMVQASAVRKYLAKTASKSMHPFGRNFVHWQTNTHTDRHTHTDTHTQTDTHTDRQQWKYNPLTISWSCNKKLIYMYLYLGVIVTMVIDIVEVGFFHQSPIKAVREVDVPIRIVIAFYALTFISCPLEFAGSIHALKMKDTFFL